MSKSLLGAVAVVALAISFNPEFAAAQPSETRKAVLITGATSGIGRLATEKLASEGYYVYAGARKDSDIAALNRIENVTATGSRDWVFCSFRSQRRFSCWSPFC